jgi:hypothetical protein
MNNMTPQEKALDLYNRMIVDFTIDKWQSKQCALIAVDEIIDTIEYSSQADETSKIIYWDKVKEEIEKL